jgi:hypothetical protein
MGIERAFRTARSVDAEPVEFLERGELPEPTTITLGLPMIWHAVRIACSRRPGRVIAATRVHGRRGGPGGASRALASAAFGWAAAIAAVIFAVATYAVAVTVMSGY